MLFLLCTFVCFGVQIREVNCEACLCLFMPYLQNIEKSLPIKKRKKEKRNVIEEWFTHKPMVDYHGTGVLHTLQ